MPLQTLHIERFRLVRDARLNLAPGTNLFSGANAQGKTTLLEAVAMLSRGRSFRASRDRECISWQAPEATPFAVVEAVFGRDAGHGRVRLALEPARKSVWVDGKPLKSLSELWGLLKTVVFEPSDLAVVQGPPALRRTMLDSLIGQVNPAHLARLAAWNRALQSRNNLLRRGTSPRNPQLGAFEHEMAEHAAPVMIERARMAQSLQEACAAPMRALSREREELRLELETPWPAGSGITPEKLRATDARVLTGVLREFWEKARSADAERGMTRNGPHRDDLLFEINDSDARTYASQGQTRSVVLALRLAELALLSGHDNEPPVLLLDDILGELDRERGRRFLELVAEKRVQTLMTATDAAAVEGCVAVERHWHVAAGAVTWAGR